MISGRNAGKILSQPSGNFFSIGANYLVDKRICACVRTYRDTGGEELYALNFGIKSTSCGFTFVKAKQKEKLISTSSSYVTFFYILEI